LTSHAKAKILNKAITEIMILGIISFITVNVIQIEIAFEMPLIDMVLAEFEMAHVWLFFVGLMVRWGDIGDIKNTSLFNLIVYSLLQSHFLNYFW
jgi:hypothetical protein